MFSVSAANSYKELVVLDILPLLIELETANVTQVIKIAMITTTAKTSINVKPFFFKMRFNVSPQ